jgi:hypothetical protein
LPYTKGRKARSFHLPSIGENSSFGSKSCAAHFLGEWRGDAIMKHWKRMSLVAVGAALLAGCGTAQAPEKQADDAADKAVSGTHRYAAWEGRWTGVEGMYLDIQPAAAGRYQLEMQYDLDNSGMFTGQDGEQGITFTRDGQPLTLIKGRGDATGLKYLADKRDCLIVKDGEGYCRD